MFIKFPASTKAGGMAFGIPDVCNTPSPTGPIPLPYPNIGQLNTADEVVDKVLIGNKEIVVEGSKMTSSSGDELGISGGVTSGTSRDEVTFKVYSFFVSADGKKVVFCPTVTAHNGSNPNVPVGLQVTSSQDKVKVGL